MKATINGERLLRRMDAFARIGATPGGGVNRQALSAEDRAARALLAEIGRSRGFEVFQDEIANLFLRRAGEEALPPLLIGSHLDSQPAGGRYDGALGVIAALEALEALEDAGASTRRPVEVVAWTNEEGSRFSPGTMGSQAFREGRVPDAWRGQRAPDGALLGDELDATLAAMPEAQVRQPGHAIGGFIELHIEQGPALEKEGLAIGVVDAIQGTRWLEVTFAGQAAHAGTTDLVYRRDPMAGAAASLAELFAGIMPADASSRFTVGRIAPTPASINAIPAEVIFTVDIRHPDEAALAELEARVRRVCAAHGARQRCETSVRQLMAVAPARFSRPIVRILEDAVQDLGLSYKRMASGAFHDALRICEIAPTAMIFVPCRDGLSHNEAEYVEPGRIVDGARMLLEATLRAADAELT